MARIKKFGTNKPQKLSTFETFLVDGSPNSTYFRITEFKDTFTGGKNGFLIEGSEYLRETTEIKIEVLDVAGNPVYYEPGKGIPEYYEGISKVVSVYVYEDTPIGIGKITILGELKNYLDDGDVLRPIPDEWKGVYNVKWEKEFKINRLLSNEDKVRFRKKPKVDIDEITRPIFSTTPILVEQTGFVNGTPLVPIAGTRLAEFSLPTTYLLTITDNSNWSGSIVGSPIQLPNLGTSLNGLDIITNKQLTVSTPFTINGVVQPFFNQPYTASFNFLDTSLPIESALSGSFAKITVTDLTTFVGDVARVKVFRKSQSEVSDFQFVQEIALESNEILIDLESSQRAQEVYGLFTPSTIETYWVSSSNDLTVGFNQDFLYNSVKLDSIGVNRFFTEKEVPINEGIEYSLDFNVRLEQNISSDNFISIFLEGERGGLTVRQNITTIQSSNPILQKSNISANFIGDVINNTKLIFEVNGSGWYLSNVSLRASQETAFSPDEITFIQPVPRTLESETFDFRFEFYDINNNYIPVLVEETKTFNGGNLNRIAKRLELKPSSLYFQFDSGSGTGNPLPPTSIFIEAEKQFLTGSINFTSRSFDFDNNEISASEYIGGQYPGLLIDEGDDIYRLTVENFTGSREDVIVQYIQYIGEVEGVSDSVVITRVSDGKGGVNFEIRPYRGTVIRNKEELATLEVQAVRIDGINEINLVSGLPLNQSDVKLFVQSGSEYITITEASQSGFLEGVSVGTTGSNELDYNAVFNRDSIEGQLTVYLIPSSSQNREESIFSTLTLTDILDGLDAGFIEYDVDAFTINPRTETVFTPTFSNVTASYYRRGTTENPISVSVLVYPSMSINEDFVPEYWLRYQTGSINSDIVLRGFDEVGNELFSELSSSFVGNTIEQNKQLTLSFNYIEPYTSESVFVDHTFSIIPEGLPGKDAIIYELTPTNVVLTADPNETVLDFSPSATEIKVKQGFDYLTFTGSKRPGTFFLEQSGVIGDNVTVGGVFSSSLFTQSVFISESVEFVGLSGSVEYLLEVHPFFTSSFFTQSLIQPYLKVLEGDDARLVTLKASSNIVNYNGDGNVISPEGDVELTATAFGATGSVYYQFFRDGIPFSTIQLLNIFEVGSGDAASIGETVLWSVQIRDGSPTSEVRAEGSVTIAGVQGGSDSYNVQLTNENSSVVQSVFGTTTLDGTGTEILVSKGATQLEGVTTYPFSQFDQLGNEIPNGKYITTIHSKPAYITLAGNLVSGSVVPVISGVSTIGDIIGWDTPEVNPTAQIVYRVDVEDGRASFLKTQSISVQFEGDTGPGIVFRGEWTGSINYIYDVGARRRDAVLRNVDNGVHYWATTEQLITASSAPFTSEPVYPATASQIDAGGWEYLGEQDLFVAAKIAIFEESFVKNTINVGNNTDSEFANIVIAGGRVDPYIAVGQTGTIGVDGDQTGSGVIGYDRAGIFMGTFDSSGNKTPRFSLKNGAGDRFLRWDGSNLDIQGSINITGGQAQTDINNSFASASNALLNAQDSGSNALDAARASGSVRPNTQRISKEAVPTDGNGLYLGSNNLGYYADGGWKTYMASNGDFFLTGSGGGFLEWNSSASNLNIAGSINITGGAARTEIDNTTATASFASSSAGTALFRAPSATGKIEFNPPPVGTGLFLTSERLGFYDNDSWKTYMDNTGQFFLTGSNANSGLSWDGQVLTIVGAIQQISPGVPEGRILGIWNNIPNGFAIFERDIVTHNGRTWVANEAHTRDPSDTPGVSAKWSIAADAGTSGTAGTAGSGGVNGANGTNGTDGAPGAAGDPGPGVVFRGEWDNTTLYIRTAERRDIVIHTGVYYSLLTFTTGSTTTEPGVGSPAQWEQFGAQFSSVATDILLAQDATITRGLVMGATNESSSFIRSVGANSLTSGTAAGFFMSSSGQFRFGESVSDAGSFVYWDGAQLEIGGIIKTRGSQNSQLGNWIVDGEGRFRDSGSKIVLDAQARAIEIFDTSDDLRLSMRQGSLPNPDGAASVTITTPTTTFPTNLIDAGIPFNFSSDFGFGTTPPSSSQFSFDYDIYITGSTTPSGIVITEAGGYRASPVVFPTTPPDFLQLLKQSDGTLADSFESDVFFTLRAELHTVNTSPSPDTQVFGANWTLGFASLETGNSGNFIPNVGNINIFLETGTYYLFLNVEFGGFLQANHYIRIGSAPGPTSNTFNLNLNKIDITDQGILVIGNANNFARMRRTQGTGPNADVLTIKGNSEFIGDGGGNNTSQTIRLNNGGIFIGGGTPLSAAGYTLRINSLPSIGAAGLVVRWESSTGRFYYQPSSRRFKTNITPWEVDNLLDKIANVNTVTYKSKNPEDGNHTMIGMIAEDLHDVGLTDVVSYEVIDDTKTPHSIDYDKLTTILWKAVQELSQKVNDLELIISGSNNL